MKSKRATVAGVGISHPDRVFFPRDGITKLELARYYEAIAPRMLSHTSGRPLTLLRCAESIDDCAFLRHSRAWNHWPALRIIEIPEQKKIGEYFTADNAAALVSLVQMDVLEVHTWSSTADHLERPDRMVFDLDPGENVSWKNIVAGALVVRDALEHLGLRSWVKTTGGLGLHVVVPLLPVDDWHRCLHFARAFAVGLAALEPNRFTASVAKSQRRGRIYLDYLRNNRGNSSVAAFSVRARDGAPVSLPIAWDDLTSRKPKFKMRSLRIEDDPWHDYFRARQRLPIIEERPRP